MNDNNLKQMGSDERFTEDQLNILLKEFSKIGTVNPDLLDQFHKLFAGCNDQALEQLAQGQIKFVSKLAMNAQSRRGGAA